ncbi:hypothetical protein Taro_010140 [Colocasia esculenta]|uniref:Uncharacterized protein n=1 Tax=Colocasia esculenta TaxID=4460 RepID=A0A843U630_COLES|nr:hypothetical protein [Colocasia esculenta]
MMTLHISTGLDWSDERPVVIAMDYSQYPRVSQMMTLHISMGLDWSDERLGVIAMDYSQYPRMNY